MYFCQCWMNVQCMNQGENSSLSQSSLLSIRYHSLCVCLIWMFGLNMLVQIPSRCSSAVAVRTLMRPLSSVCPHVDNKTVLSGHALATDRTRPLL